MRKNYPQPPPAPAGKRLLKKTQINHGAQVPESHVSFLNSSNSSITIDDGETSIVDPVYKSQSKQSSMENICWLKINLTIFQLKCFCHYLVLGNCITNLCLPSCGIKRFRTRRYSESNDFAIALINDVTDNADRIYSFIHLRLMPAIRPLLQLLYFNDSQIEADGLTRICAQIWTATYLLQSILKSGNPHSLSKLDLELVQESFMELAWEAEKAFCVDNKFYPIQQRFKRRILPEVWNLEDRYSGNRKQFVDPELRETLAPNRPYDGLYFRRDLKLKKHLQLFIISKSSPDISNLSHEESKISFEELPKENKLNLILSLLNISTSAITRIGLSLENHVNMIADEVVLKDETSIIKCLECAQIIGTSLKKIWRDIDLSMQKENEITDHVCIIIDNVNAYLQTTEWICDRLAEISGMTKLCYEYLKYGLKIQLPNYSLLIHEAGLAFKNRKGESSGEVLVTTGPNNRKKKLRKDFITAMSKLAKPELDAVETKAVVQKAEHPFTSETLKKVLEIESNFYCTEYHALLQRIPLKIDNMRLIFEKINK